MDTTTTITMLDPTGTPRDVPADQKDAALKAGGKVVVKMLDPQGTTRWIPEDQKDAALKAGGKLATPSTLSPLVKHLTENPVDPKTNKGEGLYRMRTDPDDQSTEISVPYSKVTDAQGAGYELHPDEEKRYNEDVAAQKPGVVDTALNFFRPLSGSERAGIEAHLGKVLGPAVEGVANTALGITQGTGSLVFHPLSSIYSSAQTAADALNQLFPDSGLSPRQKAAKDASLARLKTQWNEIKDNPDFALGNLFGAIEGGKLVGEIVPEAARKVVEAAKKAPETIRKAAQTTVGAGERQVAAHVATEAQQAATTRESTLEANRKADQATEKARAKIDEANRGTTEEEEAARAKVDEANKQARLETKAEAVRAEKEANAAEPFLEGDKEVTSARQAHEEVVDRQQETEAKRQKLSSTLETTRQLVYQRLQSMKNAARAYFGKAYEDIEKTSGSDGVELETLVNDAEDAREHIKGSEDSLKVFNDLESRFNHPSVDLSKPPNSDFTKEEWAEYTKEDKEHAWRDALQEEGAGATISLEDLNGYYSELGRVVSSKATPGDLRTAAKAMQKKIDMRIEETYGEDLFRQNLRVRSQYRTFAQHFLDSDSPLARAADAPDYYHATQTTFLTSDAQQLAVRNRVKGMLIGDAKDFSSQYLGKEIADNYTRDPDTGKLIGGGQSTPSWRYSRQTHQLIQRMRDVQKGLDSLPATERLAKEVEGSASKLATARETARTKAAARPEQKPYAEPKERKPYAEPKPTKPVEVPELDTRAIRDNFITTKMRQWTSLSKWQFTRLVAAPIGTIIATFTTHPSLEITGLVWTAGEVAPFVLQKLLDRPGVREWFTRSPADEIEALQKVPHADRVRIVNGFRGLIREADKQGKPLKINPALVRFIAATGRREVNLPSQPTQQDQQTNETAPGTAPESAPQGVQP